MPNISSRKAPLPYRYPSSQTSACTAETPDVNNSKSCKTDFPGTHPPLHISMHLFPHHIPPTTNTIH